MRTNEDSPGGKSPEGVKEMTKTTTQERGYSNPAGRMKYRPPLLPLSFIDVLDADLKIGFAKKKGEVK